MNFADKIYSFLRRLLRPVISFLWIKEVVGIQNIPSKGAAIIAINHQSFFDFFCLAAIAPRNIHFLAAEKFFNHWLWKHLMFITKQIRVDRKSHDKAEMHKAVHMHIKQNKLIGIFPEGTRSPDEHVMLKAYPGVAKYALSNKIPIVPVGLKGTFRVMAKHHKIPRLLKVVSIHCGKPIDFSQYHSKEHLEDIDYRTVTHIVMKQISILCDKDYPHEI